LFKAYANRYMCLIARDLRYKNINYLPF
jgi:hypothetical protein